MPIETLSFDAFATRYCERQVNTPAQLLDTLLAQKERYQPDGFMLLECPMLDSSYLGSLTILPYGPANTFKEPPTRPISPRGLASDQSVVVALLPAKDLPDTTELAPVYGQWVVWSANARKAHYLRTSYLTTLCGKEPVADVVPAPVALEKCPRCLKLSPEAL